MFTLESSGPSSVFTHGITSLRIEFASPSIARISFIQGRPFPSFSSLIVPEHRIFPDFELQECPETYRLRTDHLIVILHKVTGALSFHDSRGRVLTREPEGGGKWLTPRPVSQNLFNATDTVDLTQSIDGARANAEGYTTVFDRDAFEAKLEFVFAEDEALFGLGSHEEGYGNLRGRSRDLYQQNMKAVVPFFVSTQGYGILLDCSSLMTFHDDAHGSYLWADVVDQLDYYVIQGDTVDEIAYSYRSLTGPTPMLPKWAFGYVQSKERYVNADELLDIVREYRRRDIPLDTIVLDWKSWPNGSGWGQKSFDPARFPDPSGLLDELHALNARLMVSIWPIMTGGCADQRELLERSLMLGNQSTYNAFLSEARDVYWQQASRGLFSHGVDAWWCDCTEPFEADWSGAVKPEPHQRLAINTGQSKLYLDPARINAYSLLHSQAIYQGQRGTGSSKRVVNLTRSSYAGQHRYGTITWNGDVSATWETLRRCIPEGVNFCATGEPYWTVDIGGFFVDHNPDLWFWRGDYPAGCRGVTSPDALEPDPADTGCTDLGYRELYTRWLQYATFLPIFRSHGTDASREIWRFGEPGSLFYDVIATYIRLRYQLLLYLYSLAARVTRTGAAILRAIALDYPHDRLTHNLTDQYLFGPALMVCPVTQPMYYTAGSQPIPHAEYTRQVYLPGSTCWFDFWSNQHHVGGQTIVASAPLATIPLYVRAGSILPLTQPMQYVEQVPDAPYEMRVYCGADASFTLYEDAGDGYDYETGAFSEIQLRWSESQRCLTISARQGAFPEMIRERVFRIVFLYPQGSEINCITYTGSEQHLQRGS